MAKTSLRAQQQELTRDLIFQAVVDVVLEEGVQAFTIQRVAERAGVSHRTVYRHFPTREALLAAMAESAAEQVGDLARFSTGFPTLEDAPQQTRQLFALWDDFERLIRAGVMLRVAGGIDESDRQQRLGRTRTLLHEYAPHVSDQDRDYARYAIHALSNTVTWSQMRADWGITGVEAGDAVAYVIELIIADLKRKERRALAALKRQSD
jgi:AcrR family transcriptional regulator